MENRFTYLNQKGSEMFIAMTGDDPSRECVAEALVTIGMLLGPEAAETSPDNPNDQATVGYSVLHGVAYFS